MSLREIYGPRPVEFLGIWTSVGWKLKAYGIAFNRDRVRPDLVQAALYIAGEPLPPVDDSRSSGAGFVVIHDSEDGCYVLVDWWVEIELHQAIYFSPLDDPTRLERMSTPVIACVYELGVIDFERRLWLDLVRADPEFTRLVGPYIERPRPTGAI